MFVPYPDDEKTCDDLDAIMGAIEAGALEANVSPTADEALEWWKLNDKPAMTTNLGVWFYATKEAA